MLYLLGVDLLVRATQLVSPGGGADTRAVWSPATATSNRLRPRHSPHLKTSHPVTVISRAKISGF